jgi:predicted O-methyltransferase YrrM
MKRHFERIEDLWSICPELKNVMVGNGLQGRSGKMQLSRGTSTPNNLLVMANLILDLEVRNSLETGMAFGASTLAILAAKKLAGREPGLHVSIDPFQQLDFDDCAVMAVDRAGLNHQTEVCYSLSAVELPRRLQMGARFDLIYVDGSHVFEDAFIDAYFAVRLLREGGVVLFDDSADRHVAKVVRFLRTNLVKSLPELDLRRWRGDLGRSWRYRVGRQLGRVQLTGFQKTAEVQRDYGTPLGRF